MTTSDRPVEVTCAERGDGWLCDVTVGPASGATHHVVSVSAADLADFALPGTTPEQLVAASFEFLLDREPRQSILHRFDLPVIADYFADYPTEIGRRLRP